MADIHQERFAKLRPFQLAIRALIAAETDQRLRRELDQIG
jgi:hypothetical protein